MNIDFNVIKLEYNNKIRSLDISASGIIKSNKFFPVYNIEGEEYIFKPLSKTKPLTTPLFSYAEVVWSYIINEYFFDVPLYKLAICNGYEEAEKKYYDKGSLVANILKEGEHLVNLYEYFLTHKDKAVDIDTYINYCLKPYDYTCIFNSDLFLSNDNLSKELAKHVLVSILKADQNYHYENVAFICDENDNILRLAPMIDHEFSTMFLFGDDEKKNFRYFCSFADDAFKDGINYKNLIYICENFPDVVDEFKKSLYKLQNDIKSLKLKDNNFLWKCSSSFYEAGIAEFKEYDFEKANFLKKVFKLYDLNIKEVEIMVMEEIIINCHNLIKVIEKAAI